MGPYEVYVDEGRLYVQWDRTGPFVVVTPEGLAGEQYAVPNAEQIYPHSWGEDW